MSYLNQFIYISILSLITLGCKYQNNISEFKKPVYKQVGGNFENREWIYIGMPTDIKSSDTSYIWWTNTEKLLITGIAYDSDGVTPMPDVLIYYYHTDEGGRYLHKPESPNSMPYDKEGRTHGYIRGWVKTDLGGRYSIYTARPGAYPNETIPQHIHLSIKEPNVNIEYYIDDIVFDDDPFLKATIRKKMEYRGGSGVVRLVHKDGLAVGEKDIHLGKNIPNHPKFVDQNTTSGNDVGEDVMSFTPYHAWGPDVDTKACPVCKYGSFHGLLYFVGNNPNWAEIKKWLTWLENEGRARNGYLKVYFVYGNNISYNKQLRYDQLNSLGKTLDITYSALTFVPSFSDTISDIHLQNIDQETQGTIILFKHGNIIGKWVENSPTKENFKKITSTIDNSISEYYYFHQHKEPFDD